nr:hypothetical protein [uncultured bacterium]
MIFVSVIFAGAFFKVTPPAWFICALDTVKAGSADPLSIHLFKEHHHG